MQRIEKREKMLDVGKKEQTGGETKSTLWLMDSWGRTIDQRRRIPSGQIRGKEIKKKRENRLVTIPDWRKKGRARL